MNFKRLKQLKHMMENHDTIFASKGREQQRDGKNKKVKLKFSIHHWHCGTSACALGSAALYPPFVRQGLKLNANRTFPVLVGEDNQSGWCGYEAGSVFFDLTEDESYFLFHPGVYSIEDGLHRDYLIKVLKRHAQSHDIPKYLKSMIVLGTVKPKHVIERIDFLLEYGNE